MNLDTLAVVLLVVLSVELFVILGWIIVDRNAAVNRLHDENNVRIWVDLKVIEGDK